MRPRDSWRGLIRQIGRFGIVGAVNSVLTYVLYVLLLLVMSYSAAFTLSFAAGLVFSLLANAKITFGSRIRPASGLYFCLFYLLSYFVGLILIMFFIEVLRVPAALAPLAAMPITVPINFLGSRFAFGRQPAEPSGR
jgi:putative flippase GtrA